jgi:hypothetical protein
VHTNGGIKVFLQALLFSDPRGDQLQAPPALPQAKHPVTCWIGGLVGRRGSVDSVENCQNFSHCLELSTDSSIVQPVA